MDEGKILGTGERMTLDLTPGVENNINNPNPSNWDIRVQTAGGSVITFRVPSGGSFSILPMTDLSRIDLDIRDVVPYGPRPISED